VTAERTHEPAGADVTLRDGGTIHIRPIRPDDDERMLALFQRFSERTVYFRFHGIPHMTAEAVHAFTQLDEHDRYAFVAALCGDTDAPLVGVVRFARMRDPTRAEMALVVEDAYQGRGVGTALLRALAAVALDRGITVFDAYVLGENHAMLDLLARERPDSSTTTDGVVTVRVPVGHFLD
jgi:RimJ/RimL family protein N-acetyltransferase